MITLDQIREHDISGMWDRICTFDEIWRDAVWNTENIKIPIQKQSVVEVVICGMGGAVIGGDIIQSICREMAHLPVYINRSYYQPSFVSERSLCIIVSQSGNTEETISAYEAAGERGAQRVVISSGGILADRARTDKVAYIALPRKKVTRASLPYTMVALWRVFQHLDIFLPGEETLMQAANFLEEQIVLFSNLSDNPVIELANNLKYTLPIIYSSDGLMAPVAMRWKTQLNENSKMLAFQGQIPEMNHNEIEGWELTSHLMGKLSVILLRDESDHPRVNKRMDVTSELVEPHAVSLTSVYSVGRNSLERILFMVMYGDFTSFYLAILSEIDPMPIVKIELLKKRLEELEY
ncbi:MAG: bifunctional phosphoglucose/phosphomannose isomerase [Balneolales bacterium]|nr:bifunctional phosphoglucose/phosphomannose isomerase [Balneolales bacterium]